MREKYPKNNQRSCRRDKVTRTDGEIQYPRKSNLGQRDAAGKPTSACQRIAGEEPLEWIAGTQKGVGEVV